MKIEVRGRNVSLSAALRLRVERRLALALGRFGEQIARVKLSFSRAEGDADPRCRIDVSLRPTSIRVEHGNPDLSVALDRAADRASRSVARELLRTRH
jgi:ribosomal subunit interface protein